MKIKTEELKKFLSAAADIKVNPLHPNLDSIKIECTGQEIIFTKTNNNIWCTYSYVCAPSVPECYLVNERTLNGIVLTSKEYQIDIIPAINNPELLLITNGEHLLQNPNQDLKLFPIIQQCTSANKIKLQKHVLEHIRTAARYISSAQAKTVLNFVNINKDGIFASDGYIVYYYDAAELPIIFIDSEPLNIIKPVDEASYWTSESYDFFGYEGFVFGFIKTAITKPLNFLPIVQQQGTDSFTINKQQLIDFCVQVQYNAKQTYQLAGFTSLSDHILLLNYTDADFNISVDSKINMIATGLVELFKFQVAGMLDLLKSISYEQLIFTKCGVHYKITSSEDAGYVGMIAKLQD